MLQYMIMDSNTIKNSDGKKIQVIGFRERLKYNNKDIYETSLVGEEYLRMDLLAGRLYNSENLINGIIDANDEDIFSFSILGVIKYINKERL